MNKKYTPILTLIAALLIVIIIFGTIAFFLQYFGGGGRALGLTFVAEYLWIPLILSLIITSVRPKRLF